MRAIAVVLATFGLYAADWPQFRGPNASGIAKTTALPVRFGRDAGVVWRTPLPRGTSSPILTADRVFVTGVDGNNLQTISVDRTTGRILWRRTIARPRAEALHQLNSPASSTPVTDGANVYAFFGDFGLVSYGPDGDERWSMPLGPFANFHGMGTSPILIGEKLILVVDQDRDSYLLAVHKDTGKVLWKSARPEVVHGHATPSLYHPAGGAAQIVVPGSYQLTAYSVASGDKLWWVRGLTWQVKVTAVVDGDRIYATGWAPGADAGERAELPPFERVIAAADRNGDGKLSPDEVPAPLKHSGSWNAIDLNRDGLLDANDWSFYRARRSSHNVTLAVRPGNARGDLTDSHVVWRQERNVPQVSSPLLYRGALYTIKDGGILTAINPDSGAQIHQARLPEAIDNYFASPVAADGKVYLASETGKISVIRPHDAGWEVLAVNDLGEPCYATAALADGRVYLRTATTLYCFGK